VYVFGKHSQVTELQALGYGLSLVGLIVYKESQKWPKASVSVPADGSRTCCWQVQGQRHGPGRGQGRGNRCRTIWRVGEAICNWCFGLGLGLADMEAGAAARARGQGHSGKIALSAFDHDHDYSHVSTEDAAGVGVGVGEQFPRHEEDGDVHASVDEFSLGNEGDDDDDDDDDGVAPSR
jgi:hypothetical protein